MTLKALIAADVAGIFLNEDEHAETITYKLASGLEVSIVAIIEDVEQQVPEQGREVVKIDAIDVFLSSDPDSAKGGVESPRRGDGLVRAGRPCDEVFAFDRVIESTPSSWTLRFCRRQVTQTGTSLMRR